MSNEITTQVAKPQLAVGGKVGAIIPQNVEELGRIVKMVIAADMIPNGLKSKGNNTDETFSKVAAAIMAGAEVGFPPMKSLSSIMVINGMPCLWGDGPIALVQQSGTLEDYQVVYSGDGDDHACTVTAKRKGQPDAYTSTFTMGMAKRAGLLGKGPWRAYPERMMHARARAFVLRDGWADVLMGLSIREEVEDYAQPEEKPAVDVSRFQIATDIEEDVQAELENVVDVAQDAAPVEPGPETQDLLDGIENDPSARLAVMLDEIMNASSLSEINDISAAWRDEAQQWPEDIKAKANGAVKAARGEYDTKECDHDTDS